MKTILSKLERDDFMNNIDYLISVLIKEDKRLANIEIPSSLEEKKNYITFLEI